VIEQKRLRQFAGACGALVAMFVVLVAIEIVAVGTIA
jgi:hypothetical protein